jgi:hypothetical protein
MCCSLCFIGSVHRMQFVLPTVRYFTVWLQSGSIQLFRLRRRTIFGISEMCVRLLSRFRNVYLYFHVSEMFSIYCCMSDMCPPVMQYFPNVSSYVTTFPKCVPMYCHISEMCPPLLPRFRNVFPLLPRFRNVPLSISTFPKRAPLYCHISEMRPLYCHVSEMCPPLLPRFRNVSHSIATFPKYVSSITTFPNFVPLYCHISEMCPPPLYWHISERFPSVIEKRRH